MPSYDLNARLRFFRASLIQEVRAAGVSSVSRALTPRAYWHPNGFLKIPVRDDASGFQFRIHWWPFERKMNALHQDVHSHRWPYFSMIVSGSMEVNYFIEDESSKNKYYKYLCAPNYRGAYRMVLDGSVGLSLYESKILSANSVHYGDADTIHSTKIVGHRDLITFFVQGGGEISRSHVYKRAMSTEKIYEHRHPASTNELEFVINSIEEKDAN